MSDSCKYYKEYHQVSYDGGNTFQFMNPLEYRKGDFIGESTRECLTKQPLTFISQESGNTFTFTSPLDADCNPIIASVQYSTNGGSTWRTLRSGESSPSITKGGKIMWRANFFDTTVTRFSTLGRFTSTKKFEAEGNINSLFYKEDFSGQTNGLYFMGLFSGCTGLTTAENLILPALDVTGVTSSAYENMFRDCTNLTTAPELPAYFIGLSCYKRMFYGCSSLNYIKCTAAEVHWVGGVHKPTEEWVVGVPSNGIFIKTEGANWWMDYDNGIPEGWIVINA